MSERPTAREGYDLCECCGYNEAPIPLTAYKRWNTGQDDFRWIFLCDVCAKTYLSKSVMYSHLADQQLLFSSIGWVANELFRRLDDLTAKSSQE